MDRTSITRQALKEDVNKAWNTTGIYILGEKRPLRRKSQPQKQNLKATLPKASLLELRISVTYKRGRRRSLETSACRSNLHFAFGHKPKLRLGLVCIPLPLVSLGGFAFLHVLVKSREPCRRRRGTLIVKTGRRN